MAPLLRTLLLAISLSAAGARLAAQTVRGVVVLRDSTTPLIGAIVAEFVAGTDDRSEWPKSPNATHSTGDREVNTRVAARR